MPDQNRIEGAASHMAARGGGAGRPRLAFLQYDVFTSEPMLGNQLAVFTDAQGLDVSTMQRIAREMNFPESTFILPVEWAGTDIRMRIFTPAVEMPMAGHPTIGSTFALADTGVIQPGTRRFIFHLNAGPTPVELEWDGNRLTFAWMTQPNPQFGRIVDDRAVVAATIGLTVDDLRPDVPVQEVSCAVPFLYVPLRDPATVDRAISDAAGFKRLASATGVDLPIFLFALGGDGSVAPAGSAARDQAYAAGPASRGPAYDAGPASRGPAYDAGPAAAGSASRNPEYDAGPAWRGPAYTDGRRAGSAAADPPVSVYSRMFAPGLGIIEDPATGIASGPLGCYLVRHGLVTSAAAGAIVSHQGVAMGRASQVHISVTTDDDQTREGAGGPVITDVKVGGQAVLVARGELLL